MLLIRSPISDGILAIVLIKDDGLGSDNPMLGAPEASAVVCSLSSLLGVGKKLLLLFELGSIGEKPESIEEVEEVEG